MNMRVFCCSLWYLASTVCCWAATEPEKPNIILVLVDDLGWGDLGSYQNTRLKQGLPAMQNPHLDKLAAEGMQLRRHYTSCPVCAPARASLFSGVHQGHAKVVRDRSFDMPLEDNHTLATVLKEAGYSTALIGKWGLAGGEQMQGTPSTSSAYPTRRGFDYYFGYLDHVTGHKHYPKEDKAAPQVKSKVNGIWDGEALITDQCDKAYSTDLLTARAKKWIVDSHRENPDKPFFLALTYIAPHSQLEVPTGPYPAGGGLKGGVQWLGEPHRLINTAQGTINSWIYPRYAGKDWPMAEKRYATMVARVDDGVGDLLQLLKDLGIDKNTVVVFTSDNGPHDEGGQNPQFFRNYGPFDGIKQDIWEGGCRVPTLVRWPGVIPAGRGSDMPCQFQDWMATFADMAGRPAPWRCDGVSLLPLLSGKGTRKESPVYIEYCAKTSVAKQKTPGYADFAPDRRHAERGELQSLYLGQYKGVRSNIKSHADAFEIYDTLADPAERHNLADTAEGRKLQRQMHDQVLRMRRIYDYCHPTRGRCADRPYDAAPVPSVDEPEEAVMSVDKRGEEHVFYVLIPKDGEYSFRLRLDGNGARGFVRLWDMQLIDADFNYDGRKEATSSMFDGTTEGDAAKSGKRGIPMKAGYHRVTVFCTKDAGFHLYLDPGGEELSPAKKQG